MRAHPAVVPSQAALVFDDQTFRVGLAAVLDAEPDLTVVPDVYSTADIVIVELGSDRVPLDRVVGAAPTTCRIVAISVFKEAELVAFLLRSRVSGYVLKCQTDQEIVGAIRTVLRGQRYIPPGICPTAVERYLAHATRPSLDRLSPREREVFELLTRGHSNDELAARLYLSPRTVETHRQHIMRKLGASTVLEMIRATSWQRVAGVCA